MSSLKDNAEALQDNAITLLEAQAEYYKLWSFKVSMKSITFLVHAFLMTLFITLCVLFASLAFAFWLGEYLGSNALGLKCLEKYTNPLPKLIKSLKCSPCKNNWE
jgi:hypothetical protein